MTDPDLIAHLKTGVTHTCRCWAIERTDGARFGFTDHDRMLAFDGFQFFPQGGLSARAITTASGLSVNNTAAMGVLSDETISEADITAGRFDDAEVTVWLVQWDNIEARQISFRGTMGEITHAEGAFEVELNGLTEPLNQPIGRCYLRTCDAILGDSACGVDIAAPAFSAEFVVSDGSRDDLLIVDAAGYGADWFTAGLCEILTGDAAGLRYAIQSDRLVGSRRHVELWAPVALPLQSGDRVRLTAGCDKRAATCREKFANFLNYRGFPDMPGEDWLVSVPRSGAPNGGGSLVR